MKNHPRKRPKEGGEESNKNGFHYENTVKWQSKKVQAHSAKAESQRTRKLSQDKWKTKANGRNRWAIKVQTVSRKNSRSIEKSHRKKGKNFSRHKAKIACMTDGTAQEMHDQKSASNKSGAGSSSSQASKILANLTWKHRKCGTSQGYSVRFHWKRSRGGEWSPGDTERGGGYDGVHHNRSSGQGAKEKEGDKWSERSSSKQHMHHQHPHRKQNGNSKKTTKRKKKKKKRGPEKKGKWTIKRQRQRGRPTILGLRCTKRIPTKITCLL